MENDGASVDDFAQAEESSARRNRLQNLRAAAEKMSSARPGLHDAALEQRSSLAAPDFEDQSSSFPSTSAQDASSASFTYYSDPLAAFCSHNITHTRPAGGMPTSRSNGRPPLLRPHPHDTSTTAVALSRPQPLPLQLQQQQVPPMPGFRGPPPPSAAHWRSQQPLPLANQLSPHIGVGPPMNPSFPLTHIDMHSTFAPPFHPHPPLPIGPPGSPLSSPLSSPVLSSPAHSLPSQSGPTWPAHCSPTSASRTPFPSPSAEHHQWRAPHFSAVQQMSFPVSPRSVAPHVVALQGREGHGEYNQGRAGIGRSDEKRKERGWDNGFRSGGGRGGYCQANDGGKQMRGRGGGRAPRFSNSSAGVSASERPDKFFDKSMLEDPWKELMAPIL